MVDGVAFLLLRGPAPPEPTDLTEECAVTVPPLVEPASELTIDEVRRYSRHLIIPTSA